MPFKDMIDQLFNDPMLGRDATYWTAGAGQARVVRAMIKSPDNISDIGVARIHRSTLTLEVRSSEIPEPAAGDTFDLDGTLYVIQSEPVADRERLVWVLDVAPV